MKTSIDKRSSLFTNKIYLRVYTAFAAATFGDWFDALAIQVLVGYRWHAGPLMLALIPVSLALPGILLGSVAGVAADRLNQLKLMRYCDLLTALLTLLVIFAPDMWWLLPLLVLRSAISTVNVPAQQAYTRSIVREDQLLQATSLNGMVNQGSKIAGPLLGGLALSLLSPQWCILLNACLRASSYLLLLTIKNSPTTELKSDHPTLKEKPVPIRQMWREGWGYILRNRLLLNTLLFGLVGSMAIQMIDFQFTSLFRILAPAEESMLGWLVAATGVGAVLTIVIMNIIKQGTAYGWKLGMGYVLIGMAFIGLGMLQPGISIIPVLMLGFVMGIGNGIFMITFNYCLQKETPPHMTGRVFGIQNTILSAVMIGAPLLGGTLVQTAGPARIFMIFGILVALIGAAGILFGRVLWPMEEVVNLVDPSGELN